ncbi:MAG: hypothetical protein AAF222_01640 [Pseudomonadota bacterium]
MNVQINASATNATNKIRRFFDWYKRRAAEAAWKHQALKEFDELLAFSDEALADVGLTHDAVLRERRRFHVAGDFTVPEARIGFR